MTEKWKTLVLRYLAVMSLLLGEETDLTQFCGHTASVRVDMYENIGFYFSCSTQFPCIGTSAVNLDMRIEVSIMVKIHVDVFWVVMSLCCVVVGY